MRLQKEIVKIRDACFAGRTEISNAVLRINRDALIELLQADPRLRGVGLDLARPGESCRILQVCDVIEPCIKVDDETGYFPGVLRKCMEVGEGRTRVLSGAAVVPALQPESAEGSRDVNGEIIDMIGPAAEQSPYGRTVNLVVTARPSDGTGASDYRVAMKLAALKAAVHLAGAGLTAPVHREEVFYLPPVSGRSQSVNELPGVVYIYQVLSAQHGVIQHDPVFYGGQVTQTMPAVVHPNEILDGALVSPFRAWGSETYGIQNHPLIRELYGHHGRDLNFLGVILTIASDRETENERSAVLVANMARHVLGAEGAVLTKTGGGAAEVPLALIARQCERLGVKTSLGLWHIPADVTNVAGGVTMFNMPEICPMISMGTPWDYLDLPQVDKIIGHPVSDPAAPPIDQAHRRFRRWIRGAQDQFGGLDLKAAVY